MAAVILIIGLVSVAGLLGSTLGGTARSGYMNQAATLATEKLEDLNRYPSADPTIAAGGSPYHRYRVEQRSLLRRGLLLAVARRHGGDHGQSMNSGTTQYQTVSYTPNGTNHNLGGHASGPKLRGPNRLQAPLDYRADQPVTGVRRVTVLVTLENSLVQPPVTFQMSTVRP